MLAAAGMLLHAAAAVLQEIRTQVRSLGALNNTAAVAGLASAVVSFAKRAGQLTRAAAMLQGQTSTPDESVEATATVCFPGVLTSIAAVLQNSIVGGLVSATQHGRATDTACSNSSSSNQAPASIALLAVVLARSLLQLADAMQAVGPQLLFRCVVEGPDVRIHWNPEPGDDFRSIYYNIGPMGSAEMHTTEGQWLMWQQLMRTAMLQVVLALTVKNTAPSAAAAEAAAAATGAAAATASSAGPTAANAASTGSSSHPGSSTADSRSSGSARQQVKWGYLLRLQQRSQHWAAATAAFDAKWPGWRVRACSLVAPGTSTSSADSSSEAKDEQVQQQYTDALELCRVLVAEAPLTLLCNNPGCENLAGVREAAAARKRCAGCRCHYCSAACQAANWKRHRPACKGMAAAGEKCV
jgi:hypothetical protein